MNNLKNLSIGTVNFESIKQQYPGYQGVFGGREAKIGSWVVSLMPYLIQETIQQQRLRDQWDDTTNYESWISAFSGNDKAAIETFYPPINFAFCPSDTSQRSEFAGLSYAANAGFYLMPDDPALGLEKYAQVEGASERSTTSQRSANGLFANRIGPEVVDPQTGKLTKVFGNCTNRTRSSDVIDGTSNTIMFAEHMNNLNWRDFSITDDSSRYQLGILWLYAGKSASKDRPTPWAVTGAMRINHSKLIPAPNGPFCARPSGNHPGVIIAAFADGSTKAIDELIDYHVYQSLMAPHDAQSDIPNLEYSLRRSDYLR